MNDDSLDRYLAAIHATPQQAALAVTGGGSLAISHLLTRGGASRTVLEATVPYAARALRAYLGARPEQACSARTARGLALAAWRRALQFGFEEEAEGPSRAGGKGDGSSSGEIAADWEHHPAHHLLGVGATASLASDRPKRGPHRVHVACQTLASTEVSSLELVKGARSRAAEEQVAAQLVLSMLGAACGLAPLTIDLLAEEQLQRDRCEAPPPWRRLMLGESAAVCAGREVTTGDTLPGQVLFPGAFNPQHAGHRQMAALAEQMLGQPVAYEVSLENVDKLPLDYCEMARRASSIADGRPLWFTRAATFRAKASIFPASTFVVGVDTIQRIAEPRYYERGSHGVKAAVEELAERGCRFLVFGRADDSGAFCTLDTRRLPRELVRLCQQVPESDFRADISSTEIRAAQRDG